MVLRGGILWIAVMGCGGEALETAMEQPAPGTFVVSLEHDGLEREAVVYVPESYQVQSSTLLVLSFHGFGGIAAYHLEEADLRPQADRVGGLLVGMMNMSASDVSVASTDAAATADAVATSATLLTQQCHCCILLMHQSLMCQQQALTQQGLLMQQQQLMQQ